MKADRIEGVEEPLRILIITSSFPRWEGDSTTPFIQRFADDIAERGCRVRVLAPHAPGARLAEDLGALEVRRFRYLLPVSMETVCYGGGALINLRKKPTEILKLPALVLAQFAAVLVEARQWKPHVIHAHWLLPQGLVAAVVQMLAQVPVVATIHGGDVFGLKNPFFRPFKRFALRMAAAVTVNSSATREAVGELCPDLEPELIPTGVDPTPPSPDLTRSIRRRYRKGSGPLVMFIGRLVEEKGVLDLIEAAPEVARHLPEARFLIIGEGQDRKMFEYRTGQLQLNEWVEFLGWVPAENVASFLAAADIFVGPSKTGPKGWVEAQGLTFAEALLAGTPVIATDCGGITDLIRHEETGLVVQEGAPAAIARAIRRLTRDPALGEALVEGGRKRVLSGWTRATTADRFVHLFQDLRKSGSRPASPSLRRRSHTPTSS